MCKKIFVSSFILLFTTVSFADLNCSVYNYNQNLANICQTIQNAAVSARQNFITTFAKNLTSSQKTFSNPPLTTTTTTPNPSQHIQKMQPVTNPGFQPDQSQSRPSIINPPQPDNPIVPAQRSDGGVRYY